MIIFEQFNHIFKIFFADFFTFKCLFAKASRIFAEMSRFLREPHVASALLAPLINP